MMLASLAAVLVAIGPVVLLSRSLARLVVQMTDPVDAFGRGEPLAAPIAIGGEIGVPDTQLAHVRAALQRAAIALRQLESTCDRGIARGPASD